MHRGVNNTPAWSAQKVLVLNTWETWTKTFIVTDQGFSERNLTEKNCPNKLGRQRQSGENKKHERKKSITIFLSFAKILIKIVN